MKDYNEAHFTEKYFDSFIYTQPWLSENGTHLFYLKEVNNQKKLYVLEVQNASSLGDGQQVSHLDFNKQAFLPIHFDVEDQILFFASDEDNKENYNLFTLSTKTQEISQLTNSKYIAFSSISKEKKLIYGDRVNTQNGVFTTSVKFRNQYSEIDHELTTDKNDIYRFSWGRPVFSKNEKSFLISVDQENRRRKYNILHIDIEEKKKTKILTKEHESTEVWPLSIEFSDKGFLYASDVSGFTNIYYYSFIENKELQLSHIKDKNNGISVLRNNDGTFIVIAAPDLPNNKTILHFYQLSLSEDGLNDSFRIELDGDIHLFSNNSDSLWTKQSTLSSPSSLRKYNLMDKNLQLDNEINLYTGSKENLVHTTHRYLTYTSFDGLEIPAFLVLPKKPIKGAVITAFYGGYNSYDYQAQIFAELGLATLSPAVRGSWGFGKEWQNHIKGDLGGDEILDIMWAAHFLEKELGLSPEKIGLEGGSHGGYSVLRTLTMPNNFNSQDSKYPFGFGICWAGFADLVDFYHTSNIPGWLVDMLGDYEKNKEKYIDRSPVHHFDELNTPIFILHGTNDSRVSPSSMKGFLDKLTRVRTF